MLCCPALVITHILLWYDFGVPSATTDTFDGMAKMHFLCMERPFVRPNTKTVGGKPLPQQQQHQVGGGGGGGTKLLRHRQSPPWDGINLFGGQYIVGEEAQPEYVAKLSAASVDGGSGVRHLHKSLLPPPPPPPPQQWPPPQAQPPRILGSQGILLRSLL